MAKKSRGASVSMTSDKKWQAECDARTLADAKVVMSDPARLKAAAKAAAKMADDKMVEAKAMKNIARKAK